MQGQHRLCERGRTWWLDTPLLTRACYMQIEPCLLAAWHASSCCRPALAHACSVTCKDGGKALLQIQDNGHGIRVG